MEINYIREFLTLVSVGNYLDAAEDLFTSSTSLARHIKKLEDELGFELFTAKGRSIIPSELAKRFIPFAETLVQTQEQSFHALEPSRSDTSETLRVGIIALENSAYHLSDYIVAFSQVYPDAEFDTFEGETKELYSMMSNYELDLVFSYLPKEHRKTTNHLLVAKDTLALLVPTGDSLAKMGAVALNELDGKTFVPRPRHSFLSDYSAELLNASRISYETTIYPHSAAGLVSMVANGSGISLIPKQAAEHMLVSQEKQHEVAVVDIQPETDISVYLLAMADRSLSPLGQRFVNFIKKKHF